MEALRTEPSACKAGAVPLSIGPWHKASCWRHLTELHTAVAGIQAAPEGSGWNALNLVL